MANSALWTLYSLCRPWFDDEILFLGEALSSSHSDYPLHYLRKLTSKLRDKEALGVIALQHLFLCHMSIDAQYLWTVPLPDEERLVRSLLIACQRQMCSSSSDVADIYVSKVTEFVVLVVYIPHFDRLRLTRCLYLRAQVPIQYTQHNTLCGGTDHQVR